MTAAPAPASADEELVAEGVADADEPPADPDELADALADELAEGRADELAVERADDDEDEDAEGDEADSVEAGDVASSSGVSVVPASVPEGAEHPARSTTADTSSPTRVKGWFWGFIIVSLATEWLTSVTVFRRRS
jgi:hypothetical protein